MPGLEQSDFRTAELQADPLKIPGQFLFGVQDVQVDQVCVNSPERILLLPDQGGQIA